ncbi:hypothetical protein Tco_0675821 [Tanacetum coccineum]
MLRNCHGHNLSKGNIIKIFYHGHNKITQEVINAASSVIFLYKTPNQAYQLLEDKVLLKLDWAKNQKTKSSLKKTVAFVAEEDFDALLDEGSEILHSIEGTILEEKLFAKFDEFMAMTVDENYESKSDTEEPPFEKITFNTDYKIKTSIEEPHTDLELRPLPDNLEYVFLEEPSFLPVIISSQLFEEKKINLYPFLKDTNKPLLGKQQTFLESVHLFVNIKFDSWKTKNQLFKNKED